MGTLLIGYDLDKPGQNYESLFVAIKTLGEWWHYLDSTWLVATNRTVTQVRDVLRPHIDVNDRLLVYDVSGRASAWAGFDTKGAQWLRTH